MADYAPRHVVDRTKGDRQTSLVFDANIAGYITALIALVILPATLALLAPGPLHFNVFFVLVIASGTALAATARRGREYLSQSVFFVFTYAFLAIPGWLQSSLGTSPDGSAVAAGLEHAAGPIVLAGFIAYLVAGGAARSLRATGQRRIPVRGRLRIGAVAAIVTSTLVTEHLGGVSALFSSRVALSNNIYDAAATTSKVGGAALSILLTVPVFLVLYGYIGLMRKSNGPHTTPFDNFVVSALLVVNVAVNNPISQGRFWFLTVWGSLFAALMWRRRSLLALLPMTLLVATIFLFPFAAIFRYSTENVHLHVANPATPLIQSSDFDSIDQIANARDFVVDRGYRDGRQALGDLGFFVPRTVWTTKPTDTGTLLANYRGLPNTNVSAPLWAEGYVDGGVVLAVVYLGGLAVFHRRVTGSSEAPGAIPIIALVQLVVLRGSLLQGMGTLVAVTVIYLSLTRRSPLRRAGALSE